MFALQKCVSVLILLFGVSHLALAAYDFTYIDDLSIYSKLDRDDGCPSGDGARISANVFIPNGGPGDSFPALVLVPGWANTKYEYIKQAEYLATKGYVVLSYSPRGMGESEGVIEIVSPNDISDFCSAIDWLLENSPTDPEKIGAYGMSYGGGVSLVGLAHDARVKAVATASTWGDLENSLFEANTPNQVWIGNLLLGGQLNATVDPEIFEIKDRLFAGEDLAYPIEWARIRSPLNYLEIYNQRFTHDLVTGKPVAGVPIYISKNTGDNLFKSNRLFELYEKLIGPKKMDTSLGTHSQQEQVGMDLRPNVTWDNVHLWFDYWLRGIDNGVLDEPPMTMRVKNLRYRDYFSAWPSENVESETLYIHKDLFGGYLSESPMEDGALFTFDAAQESGVTVGSPVLTPWLEAFGIIHEIDLSKIDPLASVEILTEPVDSVLKIRGVISLSAWLSSELPRALVVSYLFDVSPTGEAKLITHGPVSLLDAVPGEPVPVNFEMAGVAYDLEPGHALRLFFDGGEWLYYSPYQTPYQIQLHAGGAYPSMMHLPVRIAEETSAENATDEANSEDTENPRGLGGNASDGKTIESGGSLSFGLMICMLMIWRRWALNKICLCLVQRF